MESNVYQSTRYHLSYDDDDVRDERKSSSAPSRPTKAVSFAVPSSGVAEEDVDAVPNKPPKPTKKMLPLVEKPADLEEAIAVNVDLKEIEERELEMNRRKEEFDLKARQRGQKALKQEINSRHFEKLLSDLTNLQNVWRKQDVNVQPQFAGGRMFVGADQLEKQKMIQENKLEAAFEPVVKAVAANEKHERELVENSSACTSPVSSSEQNSVLSEESAVQSATSSLSSFHWQDATATSNETTDETTGHEETLTGITTGKDEDQLSNSSCSDYVAQTPTSSGTLSEVEQSDVSIPPLEQNFPKTTDSDSSNSMAPSFKSEDVKELSEGSSIAPSVPIPESASNNGGSDNSSLSQGTLESGKGDGFEWLMKHNELLMTKIENHRKQIETQRMALAQRLQQLNIKVASPLRVTSKFVDMQQSISTNGSMSAPSTGTKPLYSKKIESRFSPSLSSSFISDITPRRLPSFLHSSSSASSSANSSDLSTGPITAASTPLSSHKIPVENNVSKTSAPAENFSLLMETTKTNSSASGSSGSQISSVNSMLEKYAKSSETQSAPVLPALSSTPRPEELSSEQLYVSLLKSESSQVATGSTSLEQKGIDFSLSEDSDEVAAPFRSLLVEEIDDSQNSDDIDDFDLPPPSLVGDESFMGDLV